MSTTVHREGGVRPQLALCGKGAGQPTASNPAEVTCGLCRRVQAKGNVAFAR